MKKNFLFLGFAIPEDEMKKVFATDKYPPIQTHKFNWNLIKGLESCDDFDYTYISVRPVSDYPYYPKKKIKRNLWSTEIFGKKISILEIPFYNRSVLKLVTRFFFALYYSIKKYAKVKNKGGVIVYSVHVPFMAIGYIIAKIFRIDYIAIWTDPPSVRGERDNIIKSKLRGIELFLSKSLMKKATKVIALTKYLAEDFAPGKPYIVVEGIIDEDELNRDIIIDNNISSDETKIVYTGTLDKRFGIQNLVKGFALYNKSNKSDIILEIYGRGDYEAELKEVCLNNDNIRYNGFISNEKILDIQRSADFLINARSADDDYVKYSFPSKTLEYMLSGTPVITTMLPGIPDAYKDYIIILKDNKPESIYEMLKSLDKISIEQRRELGIKAQAFAKERNYLCQGKRINEFINN